MTEPNARYAVILAAEDQFKLAPLAQALAAFKNEPQQDAAHDARGSWGIVGEKLNEEDAERLIGCLSSVKLNAVKISQSTIDLLPTAVTLVHAEFMPDGFSGVDEQARRVKLLWPQIRVIAAAGVKSTTSRTVTEKQGPTATQKALSIGIMMATGLPISVGPKKKEIKRMVSDTDYHLVFDVIANDPTLRVRVFAERVNYTFLKQRMQYNAMGNFKVLIGDMVASVPTARRGKGTRILLAGQPLNTMGYESLADLERECDWLASIP